jgi:hypothetical protein
MENRKEYIDKLNECVKKREAFLSITLSEGNRWWLDLLDNTSAVSFGHFFY